jgi:hypothetical protein
VAVAHFFRAERGEPFGIAGCLRRAERFDVFRNRVFISAGKSRDRDKAQESKGKRRQGELTSIDVHCFLHFLIVQAVSL